MLGKVFPIATSVILIAIFVVLFNFSLPKIEDFFIAGKAFKVSSLKADTLRKNFTDKEKNIWSALPCKNGNACANSSGIKSKIETHLATPYIKRSLVLNKSGVEVFSNRPIDAKYRNLVLEADTKGRTYLIERIKSQNGRENKLITVVRVPNDDKFILSLFDFGKISIRTNLIIYFLIALVPISLIFYSLIKLQKGGKTIRNNLDMENQNYLMQIETLRKENVQQSQFLANFTHELRTPLNSIIGFSGLIKDQTLGSLGNPEYVKYANDINTSGVHLLSLINDILDYSKSEVGKLKVNMTEVDVVKVIKQSLSIIAPRASESNVDLMQSFANDYFIIRLDPKRFKQIMLNLLSNSVKFTPEGGSVMVSVFPDLKGEKISIEVKDTGVGIAEKDIPTVMSLFGQVETDLNRKYEGTGIGLPFAKKLTAIMGGIFDLQSKVGIGTRITLTFPYDKKLNAEYAELFKKNSSESS